MYKSLKGTRYEGDTCGCGNEKKGRSKYCTSCSSKLNLLRANVSSSRDDKSREINHKELEAFIRINNL